MELTYEAARQGLLKLANERPHYVHTDDIKLAVSKELGSYATDCLYRFHDGTPGCIVGALVADLFPDVELQEGATASNALRRAGITFDEITGEVVDNVQQRQDNGYAWAQAVENI